MILMYHKVHPTAPTMWWVSVDEFYRQMWELQSRRVVTLDEYDPADPSNVVITFDGVYDNVLRFAAPVMQRFGYPFELFVTGDMIGGDNAFDHGEPPARFADMSDLARLRAMGGRLQWHTRSHPDMRQLNDAGRIAAELDVPDGLREDGGCRWFAYPYGRFNDAVRDMVATRFAGAVSCDAGSDADRYAWTRLTVTNDTTFRRGTIACIVASYNYGPYLAEAVESVLRQTIPPQEILITDDCSQDETQEIGRELAARHPGRIRYNRNERNLGIVEHFNRAVALTTSDYIVILGADNRLRSNYLEECAAVLETDQGIGVAYTDLDLFGTRASAIYATFPEHVRGRITGDIHRIVFPDGGRVDARELRTWNVIHGSSMYRRAAFDAAGGYAERAHRPEDHDLFARMIDAGWRAGKAAHTALEYRQHSIDQANIRFTSYATLLHYMNKSRRLEHELSVVRSSPWPWLRANARGSAENVRRFAAVLRESGITAALRATRDYFAARRSRSAGPD